MSDKIFLTKEEQMFLMEMLEVDNPTDAAEKFAYLMVKERADPGDMQEYVKKIIKRMK